ncbi:hypothetical protein FOYG_08246 [Fusarium oxysporum NRRL 32931]|uniref:Uncharacterized protein n=3 Tax=Fusarium oxysporum TaxID=5507 RepID=W9I8J4_FUSOX|nr:hypothetical protein FOYG_08246 [Fusarium oxysporum NRRL 32931]
MMLGMLPDSGAPVTFFLNADCRERVPIKVPLAAKQITRMNRDVAFALRHGKRKASNRLISIAQEIEAERKPKTSDEDKIASLQAPITEKCDRTFAKHAVEPVNHIIKITSTAAESPGKPSYVQRAAIAKAVVRELRRRADGMIKSTDAQQVLDLFVHVHGMKGFTVGGIDDPANEPAVAPITKYDNPAPKFLSKVDQFVNVEPTPATAKVAWTAGQNKLVDDAAHRASQARPDNVLMGSLLHLTNILVNRIMSRCDLMIAILLLLNALVLTITSRILSIAMLVASTLVTTISSRASSTSTYSCGRPPGDSHGMQRRSRSPQEYRNGYYDDQSPHNYPPPPRHNALENGGLATTVLTMALMISSDPEPELTQEYVLRDGFLNALFDNWNSRFDPPPNPELPADLKKKHLHIDVGIGTLKIAPSAKWIAKIARAVSRRLRLAGQKTKNIRTTQGSIDTALEEGGDNKAHMNIYQLTAAEVSKTHVDVRIIDDSLSHEADYAFVDLTRTTNTGFISEPE